MTEPEYIGMPEVTLALDTIVVVHGELRVPYVLDNQGSVAVFAFNLLVDRYAQLAERPGIVPTPALAQTCAAEDGVVLMRLGIVPAPPLGPRFSMVSNPKPSASRIEPGRGLAATVRAPLPLVEWTETWMPMRDAPENVPVAITTLRLQVECAREADVTWLRERDTPGAYDISAARSDILQVEQDVSALGVVLLTHPQMYRFG